MPRDLPDGLYEHIVTDGLARDLTTLEPARRREVIALDGAEAHESLARHLSIERESGKRYIESPSNGWTFHLFVRTDPEGAYAYAGPVAYVSHEGDRPIAITWRLEHALPAALFQRYATLAQG